MSKITKFAMPGHLFGVMLTMLLALQPACAQKISLPQMGGQGITSGAGNILQVEGRKGQVIKIDYVFNYRKQQLRFQGTDYYPTMHDQILYSAAYRKLTLTTGIYTLSTRDGQRNDAPGNRWNFALEVLPDGSKLKAAIDDFIRAVGKQAGSDRDQALTILHLPDETLKNQVMAIEAQAQ